uniref:Uncharacterized protein n=1 Tax=Lotus japonicus TaxID=34305 RepID=I3S6R9_LOTJA|nr:unknown [Lotus japonicus]
MVSGSSLYIHFLCNLLFLCQFYFTTLEYP